MSLFPMPLSLVQKFQDDKLNKILKLYIEIIVAWKTGNIENLNEKKKIVIIKKLN